jgi:serine/threonine-protein kinase RsbW
VEIAFSVRLPVDASSVPFVRGLCRQALEHLGVDRGVVEEVSLALSEACANVVLHAGAGQDYQVEVDIDDRRCRISVHDTGQGFDPEAVAAAEGSVLEGGRGLALMRALVDTLQFRHEPGGGHRVTFEKALGLPVASG